MMTYFSPFPILPSGRQNPYGGGSAAVEAARSVYRKRFPNINIPTTSIEKSLESGNAPFVTDEKGEKYFLTPDNSDASLQATENESARRQGRKPQKISPTYSYKTEGGKKFSGTFLGDGAYKGFGGGGYGGLLSEMRAAKRKNPYGPESTEVFAPRTGQRGPAIDPWQQRETTARIQQNPESSMGMMGSPLSYTGFGQMAGMAPQPTPTIARSPFERDQLESLTGFGGVPMFPYY